MRTAWCRPSAVVNTAGLVATTADIYDADFMQGHTDFRIAGSDNAQISNQGVINAPGGRVALLAPHVENTGTISANGGVVVLATGQIFLVDLFGDGLIQVATAHQHGAFGDLVHFFKEHRAHQLRSAGGRAVYGGRAGTFAARPGRGIYPEPACNRRRSRPESRLRQAPMHGRAIALCARLPLTEEPAPPTVPAALRTQVHC